MATSGVAFRPEEPNVARMYDYMLGGKDNFPADREAARRT
ncbi:MAG TPA: SAM-dependent methyltransferase, partial [Trebonia sp.]|nr:SAM-dependent methyltransferase [Trebonia sp.]